MERVGIYNRCSTEEEAQINALETQAQESREIAERKGWKITAQYVESETGTTTKNRMEYQRMMEDIENHVFDIIMIKSIDRLMRSTKDWYLFIDKVVSYNKKLFIYMDNKFYEPDDALITGIKAILAEDFSRELSKKIKHAHKRRQDSQLGLNFTKPIFGWNKVEKDKYIINEEEAEYYRLAFCMAYQGYGFYTIAKYMYEQGARSKVTGEMISDVQWRNMVYSPRAHGTVVLHKREYDFNTKKYIKIPPEQWIYVEHALPPIVTREYQEMVLGEIKERTIECSFKTYTRAMSKTRGNPLSGKIYCGCCGAVYYRWVIHKGEKRELVEWKCKTKMKRGATACKNKNVIEDVVMEIVEGVCKQQYGVIFDTNRDSLMEKTIKIAKKTLENNNTEKELKKLEKELSEQEQKKAILLEKLIGEVINDSDFQIANVGLSKKIEGLKDRIKSVKEKVMTQGNLEERLLKIRTFLQEGDVIEKAETKDMIKKIDKIIVYSNHTLEIQFNKLKLMSFFKIHNVPFLEEEMEKRFFKIVVPYTHKDNKYRKREQVNKKLLEIFKKNPRIKRKDVIPIFEMKESYINASIKQLKEEGKLQYKSYGGALGEWIVTDKE